MGRWIHIIPRSITNLNGEAYLKEQSLTTLKKLTEILVIDDNVFSFLDALKKYEFSIQQKIDLSTLQDAAAYDIILCDIRGVGKFLESKFDGANLIKELKTKYPNKTLIAYTANDYDASFQKYLSYADEIVPKGSYGLEDWVSLLERIIQDNADPVKQWAKTRKALLDAGVSTIDTAKYESQYVKAIKEGNFDSFKKLYDGKNSSGSKIMIELASSVIAKLINPI